MPRLIVIVLLGALLLLLQCIRFDWCPRDALANQVVLLDGFEHALRSFLEGERSRQCSNAVIGQ
jgi:hypothetical protein